MVTANSLKFFCKEYCLLLGSSLGIGQPATRKEILQKMITIGPVDLYGFETPTSVTSQRLYASILQHVHIYN